MTEDEIVAALTDGYGRRFAALKRQAKLLPWDGRRLISDDFKMLVRLAPENKVFSLLLTFDMGYHNSGWWRNSDYDTCWHASLVMVKGVGLTLPTGFDPFETPAEREVRAFGRALFGGDVKKAWVEPPASAFDRYRTAPQSRHCWHIRLFVDRQTGEPILPSGEVYHLTPWPEGDSPAEAYH